MTISVSVGGAVYYCADLRSAVVKVLSSPSAEGMLKYDWLVVTFACIRQLCWLHGVKASSEDVSAVERALKDMMRQGVDVWGI